MGRKLSALLTKSDLLLYKIIRTVPTTGSIVKNFGEEKIIDQVIRDSPMGGMICFSSSTVLGDVARKTLSPTQDLKWLRTSYPVQLYVDKY